MILPWRTPEFGPQIHTSLTTNEAKTLEQLAKNRDVVEIGSAYGYSTILMAKVARHVTSIDPHIVHNSRDTLEANLAEYKVEDRVTVCIGNSQDILPELPTRYYGLVFIDGDHRYEQVKFDRDWAIKLGTVIAFHDYDEDSCPGVKQALDEWLTPSYITDTLAVYITNL